MMSSSNRYKRSIKDVAQSPTTIINTAISLNRSQKYATIIVEGENDARFLRQWITSDVKVRFAGFGGKKVVIDSYNEAKRQDSLNLNYLTFVADVDFDGIHGQIINDDRFIYNEFCYRNKTVIHNDLEGFLFTTKALEKYLANHDIEAAEVENIRVKIEKATKIIGSYRLADIQLQSQKKKKNSILNGIEVSQFISFKTLEIDVRKLQTQLPRWSNYPELVDDLIQQAAENQRTTPQKWLLSRGHDITEILCGYLNDLKGLHLNSSQIEQGLRLACERDWFVCSSMGNRISDTRRQSQMGIEVA